MRTGLETGANSASVVIFLFALFLFASPFTVWWAALNPPWYLPYLIWLALTAACWLAMRRAGHHEL